MNIIHSNLKEDNKVIKKGCIYINGKTENLILNNLDIFEEKWIKSCHLRFWSSIVSQLQVFFKKEYSLRYRVLSKKYYIFKNRAIQVISTTVKV